MREKRMEAEKPVWRGEAALVAAVIMNTFGVVLMLYSGSGISAISSVPFAFSEVFPHLSLGTWTYLFQGLLILSLMILRKRFVPEYLFSFVVGFVFGELLDVHELWIHILPETTGWRVIYFVVSYLLISFGIALSNRCRLPIVPTDLFPREMEQIMCDLHHFCQEKSSAGMQDDNRMNRNNYAKRDVVFDVPFSVDLC